MDESAFGENRRAILELYETFLKQNATILVGVAVAVLSEIQLKDSLGLVFWALLALTVVFGADRLIAVRYWNRRIEYLMLTEVKSVPDGKDSLKWLDLTYYDKQRRGEKGLLGRWTNWRYKPRIDDKALEYIKSDGS